MGCTMQSCGEAACRAVLANTLKRWMVLAHMVKMVTQGQMQTGAAGMGSRQRQAGEAWQGKCGPASVAPQAGI